MKYAHNNRIPTKWTRSEFALGQGQSLKLDSFKRNVIEKLKFSGLQLFPETVVSEDTITKIILPVEPMYQGDNNACGTASAAMILNSLLAFNPEKRVQRQKPYTREELDQGNRELNCYLSPLQLKKLIRKEGFFSELLNHMDFEAVKKHLDQQ